MQAPVVASRVLFVAPSASEGSLSTCVPWENKERGVSLTRRGLFEAQTEGGVLCFVQEFMLSDFLTGPLNYP